MMPNARQPMPMQPWQQQQQLQQQQMQQQQQQLVNAVPSDAAFRNRLAERGVRFGDREHAAGYGGGYNGVTPSMSYSTTAAVDLIQPGTIGMTGAAPTQAQGASAAQLSESLGQELQLYAPVATPEQSQQIEDILAEVQHVCEQWAMRMGGGSLEGAGQLLPIGSYALVGLQANPGGQIDCVFVAPLGVQLKELADRLHEELSRKQECVGIASAGPDGHLAAPGVQFTYRGVSVKILLSHRIPGLPQPSPHSLVPSAAGLLAFEVSEQLLASVPNVNQFSLLLRFVRFWARQRGIYGSHVGFFGGTAWAICCARVCQMHPYLEISQLVTCFFRVFTRWDWRQPVTVILGGSDASMPEENMVPNAGAASAGGEKEQGGEHKQPVPGGGSMVVQLPVGQGISAREYVTDTCMKIMLKEFRRGYKVVQQVEISRARWGDIYAYSRFFQRFRHYLELDFMASSPEILAKWIAWSEQNLIQFVPLFESMSSNVVTLRPWPEMLEFKDAEWPCARALFVGLHLERAGANDGAEGGKKSFDLREPVFRFLELNAAWPEAQKYLNQFELLIRHVRLAELETWLSNRKSGIPVNSKDNTFAPPPFVAAASSSTQELRMQTPPGAWNAGGPDDPLQCAL